MPTQQGVGFEDERSFLPVLQAACQEDEPKAIRLRKVWLLDPTVQDNQLLPEKSILGDQFGLTTCKVSGHRERDRMTGGLGEVENEVIE